MIKDRDVSLYPRCNAVFDAEVASIFEKERMKKELAHREEQARQRQPIRRIEGQSLKTPQPSVTPPLSRSQAIGVQWIQNCKEFQKRDHLGYPRGRGGRRNFNQSKKPQSEVSKGAKPSVHSQIVFPSDGETYTKGIPSPTKMEKGKAIAQSSGVDKGKEVDVKEDYFEKGDDDMVGTISIIPTKYLGEYEGDPEEDYDMEDEEAFSFIRIEDEPGHFLRPTEKQMSHIRPLHITTSLNGIKVNKVLIDGGAAIISLLSERMLMKVEKHPDDLVPTNIAMTDFSGVSMPPKGLVTLTVNVGSSERNMVFVVVPSKASYNALLVPSTVHQSVLLWMKDEKPKIVKADSNLYVEQLHVNFRMYNPKLKPLNVD
ncbi:hypothetical protein Ahy_A01g000663 [Arachis hypogaea]|uniref:Aspartic peptidase DDI1-type domain-containing protein n=1 Tax=Arachis hypogaea TaxID=3818 RepID=A0A445EL11_ARAHY|nr:hypothetical protein Ahy_A01g000663 [Arachis hypogaea]